MAAIELQFLNQQESRAFALSSSFHVLQKHTDICFSLENSSEVFLQRADLLSTADGMYANVETLWKFQKPLLIKSADCCPLFYVSKTQGRVAAIHAGWRGLLSGIHLKPFVEKWLNPYETEVTLGPCISSAHYEVGRDVWSQFQNHVHDSEVFVPHVSNNEKRMMSMSALLAKEFQNLGLKKFSDFGVDTYSNEAFCSFRRDAKPGLNNFSTLSVKSL